MLNICSQAHLLRLVVRPDNSFEVSIDHTLVSQIYQHIPIYDPFQIKLPTILTELCEGEPWHAFGLIHSPREPSRRD